MSGTRRAAIGEPRPAVRERPAWVAELPRKPLLVVGGYGYRNLGDEAMLAGLLEVIGRDGVTVVSRSPEETARQHHVATVGIPGALRALGRHRGLVIGGGGLFGRHMGSLGRLLPPIGLLASAGGRRVALVGVGIDEDLDGPAAVPVWALARRTRPVVVRDEGSARALRRHGIASTVGPDLSSWLSSAGWAAGTRLLRAAGLDPVRRPVVGLCLTAVEPALTERVLDAVTAVVDALPDHDVCAIPLSRHPFVPAHDDSRLARRLVARRPGVRVLGVEGPADVLGVFEALRAVIAMRYHGLVFAERTGIPIVPIAYAPKCRQWLAERDLRPIEPDPKTLVAAMRTALAERAPTARQVAAARPARVAGNAMTARPAA